MLEKMDIDNETKVTYLKDNKRKIEISLEETYNRPRKVMIIKNQAFPRLSQDEFFQKEIDEVEKRHSEGKKFELLEESLDKREETDNAYGNNNNNKELSQQPINNKEEQPPIFSRKRKKKKHCSKYDVSANDSKVDYVQDNVNQSNQSHNGENTIIDHPNIKKEPNIGRIKSDEKQVEYSNPCGCQPLVPLPCVCSNSVYLKNRDENFDYEMIIKEFIPDQQPPIEPIKTTKEPKIKRIIKGVKKAIRKKICNTFMIHGYESDEQSDENMLDQTANNSSTLKKAFDYLLRQFDPLFDDLPSTSHFYSSALINEPSNSTAPSNSTTPLCINCESHSCSSIINYIRESNNNRHDFLSTERISQHTDPQSSSNSLHLLVIFIAFECYIERPNYKKCHSLGYHPILRHFGNPIIDGNDALDFVHDSIMNCWANSWKAALVVSGEAKGLNPFFTNVREIFENEILDIIFIQPLESPYSCYLPRYLNRLNISVAKDSNTVTWKQEYNKIIQNVIQKAYRDGDKIFFYNKDEPYYEFTNFYRAPIRKDFEEWPTTEHYFQAAKFKDRHLRNKIRFVYSAREAFTIARKNDFQKREDWESPKPPDNEIFKEGIMREALFLKFTQHKDLKYKLLSTGKVKIFEHTENDRYWGDGGKNQDGLNKLGIMLQELRKMLMDHEKVKLIKKYNSGQYQRWFLSELKVELNQFDDLIVFDD